MAADGRGPPARNRPRSGSQEPREERPFDVWLNRQLHAMYDEIAKEPLPRELVELIERDGRQGVAAASAAGASPQAASADESPPTDKK